MNARTALCGFMALGCAGFYGDQAQAAKIQIDDKTTLTAGVLLQAQAVLTPGGAVDGSSLGTDFFMRRARIMLGGSWNDTLSFFIETDQPNFGKDDKFTNPIFVQDAYLTFKVAEPLMFDAGMILLPFTHQGMQGATSLNTLDYHSALIKYAPDSTKVWRDVGVQLRGQVLEGRLHYRVGVFNGTEGVAGQTDASGTVLEPLNPTDAPRLAGRIHYSILGKENDFFLKGIYFAKSPIVTLGVGGNFQPNVFRTADGLVPEKSFGADVFVDYPLGDAMEVLFQSNVFVYPHETASSSGLGYFAEAGFRVGAWEPLLFLDQFTGQDGKTGMTGLHAGLNYWVREHNGNVKLDLGSLTNRTLDASNPDSVIEKNTISATLQGQLLF